MPTLWHMFDPNFTPNGFSNNSGTSQQNNLNGGGNQSNMPTMVASPDSMGDDGWFPDSRATNHIINDLSNLSFGHEYTGNYQILMGNGASLRISHTGSSSFRGSQSYKVFTLSNLLHVPSITKNFISISQFAKEN